MFASIVLASLVTARVKAPIPPLVPTPLAVNCKEGSFVLRNGDGISGAGNLSPLARLCSEEFEKAFGVKLSIGSNKRPAIALKILGKMAKEQYRVTVGNRIEVIGGSYQAVAYGTTTLLQWAAQARTASTLEEKPGSPTIAIGIPRAQIDDCPAFAYRGAMVDVARRYHSIDTLKQIVDLCRFYKVRYLQLHLTDDQAFTFPSKAFPQATASNQHGGPAYTIDELKDLVSYADQRGVTIVPEFDVPGHSAALIRTMPDLFKIKGTKPYEHHATINFANPEVLKAVGTIIGEMCAVFKSSPYFHIGGDEADIAFVAQHPDFKKLIAQYGLSRNPEHELYRRFLGQINEVVEKRGKRMLVWEGFSRDPESRFPIPKDVAVMVFESAYNPAPDLIADGYTVINSAWTPLYIVNRHVWKPKKVYDWSITEFGRFSNRWQETIWLNASGTTGILGAQACEWEQPEGLAVQGFLGVLPAMSERVWNPSAERDYAAFEPRLKACNELLGRLLSPVDIAFEGLTTSGEDEFDLLTFEAQALARLTRRPKGCSVRYTTDGRAPRFDSPEWNGSLKIEATATLRVRAFGKDGKPCGGEFARTLYRLP